MKINGLLNKIPLELRGQMATDTFFSLLIKLVNTGSLMLLSVILGRFLGASEYGAYAYSLSWLTTLSFLALLGLDSLSIREIPQALVQKKWNEVRGYIQWAVRLSSATGFIISLVSAIAIFNYQSMLSPSITKIIWIAAPILCFLPVLRLSLGLLQGLGKIISAQIPVMIVLPVSALTLNLGLLISGNLNAKLAISAYGFSTLLAIILAGHLLVREVKKLPQGAPKYHSGLWLKSALFFSISGFTSLLNQQIGVLMLGTIASPEAAGTFDIVTKLATLVSFVLMAVNMAIGPRIADLYARKDFVNLQRMATRGARFSLIGATLAVLFLIIFGNWLLSWLGGVFEYGFTSLLILCAGQFINAAAGSVGMLLNMAGFEKDVAIAIVFSAIVNAAINLFLIPQVGINGAAIASLASNLTWNVFLVFRVLQRIGIEPTSMGIKRLQFKEIE